VSLIREESENRSLGFPWSKKPQMDFLRPYQAPRLGAAPGSVIDLSIIDP